MSEKLTKDFPAVRAAGRSAKASIAATRLHLEHKMQDEITALRAQVERLKADLERERMRLVACGVVALANTAETAAKAREMSPEYWSASCGDVARAVDREMDLRARLAASEETVRGLRGFAQAAVALAQHGRGDMPLLVQCRMRGLLDDKGNPTPLLTGAAAGEGERDVQG